MLEHSGLRGTEAVRFVTIPVNGRDVRVALAHGLANAAKLLDQIENGEVEVDLVEVMSCRTGCVGGAGQPYALMSTKLKRAPRPVRDRPQRDVQAQRAQPRPRRDVCRGSQ